ncbi:DNA translocase FtsK [Shouchella lehensis]|uniref:DNA translocase FtsK n=1 Tax=Shouchella lehensis TaxID=300825 RepID=A0A4Y7WRN1_9BACI|nr:DNA translocase FtsK [Shouchella lehensis]TES51160.1 DNA translocase FtsK [Shouchella lehensis]
MSIWNKWARFFKGDDEERDSELEQPLIHDERNEQMRSKNTKEEELEEARMTFYYGYAHHNDKGTKEAVNKNEQSSGKHSKKSLKNRVTNVGNSTFFQGNFKPTATPSPIHGLPKDPIRDNSDYNWLLRTTRQSQQTFMERINEKDHHLSQESDQEDVHQSLQPKVDAEHAEHFEDVAIVRKTSEQLAGKEGLKAEKQTTYGSDDKKESTRFHTTDQTVLPILKSSRTVVSKEIASKRAEAVEQEDTESKQADAEIAVQEKEEPKQVEAVEQEDTESKLADAEIVVQEKEELKQAEAVEAPSQGSDAKEHRKEIPFNVLMLPSDRRKKKEYQEQKRTSAYEPPPLKLLLYPERTTDDDGAWLDEQATLLEETLQSFHVDAKVVNRTKGPAVTRFEIQPARGVKVNKITNLTDDIKLSLAAKDIRIEAPIPGKNAIGIEVPNRTSNPVMLREILRRDVFRNPTSPLTAALGLDISGNPVVTDLNKMPHGLVAGATGSGKSVCINSILISLLYKASPEELKLLLVDPKMVELAPYHDIPHLLAPVITDPKQATASLKWVVQEMERRYELFSQMRVRDIEKYNERYDKLPYILVVIDELADLMMVSPQDVEDAICRIAQKARACGIHLLLATQRPSVDVITGLIKANIPTRIAFSVSSQTDSRTILDMGGAERLLGRGDMLFHENGASKPVRVQGTFVSDDEIEAVIEYVKKQGTPNYAFESETIEKVFEQTEQADELFEDACYFVVEQGSASASSIQRRFRVGYNRAARLIDMMEQRGVISGAMGSKPRTVLATEDQLKESDLA